MNQLFKYNLIGSVLIVSKNKSRWLLSQILVAAVSWTSWYARITKFSNRSYSMQPTRTEKEMTPWWLYLRYLMSVFLNLGYANLELKLHVQNYSYYIKQMIGLNIYSSKLQLLSSLPVKQAGRRHERLRCELAVRVLSVWDMCRSLVREIEDCACNLFEDIRDPPLFILLAIVSTRLIEQFITGKYKVYR